MPIDFGNVDIGKTILATEDITSGLHADDHKMFLSYMRNLFSALYVIDLVRFRQLAAGDRLRGQYQVIT